MTIEEKLEIVEGLFYKRLSGEFSDSDFCKELSVVLGSIHENKYDVCLSNQNHKEKFYGMRIFPAVQISDDTADFGAYNSILAPMLDSELSGNHKLSFKDYYDKWKHQNRWVLEIDASVFDHQEISFNPKELVAMLLHEIGHVIYSSKTLERIYQAMMDMKITQTMSVKYTMSLTTFLFYPVIISACKLRQWMVGKNDLKVEIFADKNVVEYGYGEHLISAFGKVVKRYGRGVETSTPDTEAAFSADMVTQLSARHCRVGQELYIKAARSSSNYIQSIYRRMLMKLGVLSKSRYTGVIGPELPAIESLFAQDFISKNDLVYSFNTSIAMENFCLSAERQYRMALEGFFSQSNKKYKITDEMLDDLQYDIDKISIDIDKICSHHDRIYVLDLIYDANERLNVWRTGIDEGMINKRYSERVQRLFEQIVKLRQLVLSKKNFDKRYELFVKYPVGYEG